MAQFRTLFLLAASLAAALPAALAIQNKRWESDDVNVPRGLVLALRHNHGSCSRPPVPGVHQVRSSAATLREEGRKHRQRMPGNKGKNNLVSGRKRQQRKKHDQEQVKMKNSLTSFVHFKKGVDFSGNWVISKVEGNMDKLMQKMGMNFIERQAARMFNYGVGHITEKIKQNDDDFVATVKTELGTEELHYKVGVDYKAGEGVTAKSVGKRKNVDTLTCSSNWADAEKNELVTNSSSSKGKALPQLRRSLVGGNMVVKMILDDAQVSVIYNKK